MKNLILAWATWLAMSTWSVSAEENIHAFIPGTDGNLYASTFAKDASKAMNWEWDFENEVCWGILVLNLPQELQDTIMSVWWDVEQVRECTQLEQVMHDL